MKFTTIEVLSMRIIKSTINRRKSIEKRAYSHQNN